MTIRSWYDVEDRIEKLEESISQLRRIVVNLQGSINSLETRLKVEINNLRYDMEDHSHG